MDQLDEIRQKIDIVPFINEYLPLKKAGRNFRTLCPFHSEKTPSFIVSPERQIWHCFGCQLGGDIFTFLMKYENLEFPEALRVLAKRAGVALKNYQPTEASRLKDRLYEINHLASEFYHYLLVKHLVGRKALDYALARGISQKSIETFSLGYSPNLWDGLIKFLVNKKKYQINDLDKAGLVVRGRGQFYDRFRGRLMFTLKDHRGNVVGFAGRILPQEKKEEQEKQEKQGGKYINSPETPIYVKGNVLYGLEVTHEAIKKANKAVVVEGEIDLISSFQAGVANVVAIKGSALTENQVNLIKRYTDNLTLGLDMDIAGDSAARRGIETAENVGLDIKVIELPFGKDPAEVTIKSPDLWKKAVLNPISVYDYLLKSAIKRYDRKAVEGKRKIAQEFLTSLSKIDNEIIKSHYLKKLALEIEVSLESVISELNKVAKKGQVSPTDDLRRIITRPVIDREERLEEYLLSILLQTKRAKLLLGKALKIINIEDFKTISLKKIFSLYQDFLFKNDHFKIEDFAKILSPEIIAISDRLYLTNLDKVSRDENLEEKEVIKAAKEIKKLVLKRGIKKLANLIKEADNNEELLLELNLKFKKVTTDLEVLSNHS